MAITGKTILNTRSLEESAEFINILESCGANVITVPMIKILPVNDWTELDEKIKNIINYSAIIFTSSNGAKYFFERIKESDVKIDCKIFAAGEKTKEKIEEFGYCVSFIPDKYGAHELADYINKTEPNSAKYLFPCGDKSMRTITGNLNNVDEVVVYKTMKPDNDNNIELLKSKLDSNKIDCIAFFSPSAVSNFLEFFPGFLQLDISIAAIGNTTAIRINESGLNVNIKPEKSTSDSMAEAIINYYN